MNNNKLLKCLVFIFDKVKLSKKRYLILDNQLNIIFINSYSIEYFKQYIAQIKSTNASFNINYLANGKLNFRNLTPKDYKLKRYNNIFLQDYSLNNKLSYKNIELHFEIRTIRFIGFRLGYKLDFNFEAINFRQINYANYERQKQLLEELKLKIINLMLKNNQDKSACINIYNNIDKIIDLNS